MKRTVGVLLLFVVSGCSIPRLFQSSVPAPVQSSPAKTEAERAAADLLAHKIETPKELIPVAVSLSTSLGAPQHSLLDVKTFDLPSAAAQSDSDLRAGILDMQKQLATLNKKLTSLQGKDIEGTGISLLGPGTITIVVALIALGVIFPPAFTLMALAYRRIKATAGIIVDQVEEAAKSPEAQATVDSIKAGVSKAMGDHSMSTKALKNTVLDLKKS